jgi:hypothetical protein
VTDDAALLEALARNASAGASLPDPAGWVARMSPGQRALHAARQMLVLGRPGAVIEPLLTRDDPEAPALERLDRCLLLANLSDAAGRFGDAATWSRRAYAELGWPPPATGHHHAITGGVPGIGAALAAGRIVVIDALVGAATCAAAAAELDELDARGLLTTGGFYDSDHERAIADRCDKRRADLVELVERHGCDMPGLLAVTLAIRRIVLGNNYFEGTRFYPLELQIAAYDGDGARYAAHTDVAPGDALRRRLSMLYYPNPGHRDVDGGALCVRTPTDLHEIAPLADRLVMFDSAWVHEVLPCQARRRSVTSWVWA